MPSAARNAACKSARVAIAGWVVPCFTAMPVFTTPKACRLPALTWPLSIKPCTKAFERITTSQGVPWSSASFIAPTALKVPCNLQPCFASNPAFNGLTKPAAAPPLKRNRSISICLRARYFHNRRPLGYVVCYIFGKYGRSHRHRHGTLLGPCGFDIRRIHNFVDLGI